MSGLAVAGLYNAAAYRPSAPGTDNSYSITSNPQHAPIQYGMPLWPVVPNSFQDTSATKLYAGPPQAVNIFYRPLQLGDFEALKAIHHELFPIDYEEVFFRKAVSGQDRVFTWAAVHNEQGSDHLVGFVTARLVYFYECDPVDREVMGLSARSLDGQAAVYVLTLGVVEGCRQCGVARSLLGLVQQHAARLRCRVVFLHVISYNTAAMRLYGSSGYGCMARLPNFYHLITGRQPNPEQQWYDAYLYASFLPGPAGPEASYAMQWAGGLLGAAAAPFRSACGSCMQLPAWLGRRCASGPAPPPPPPPPPSRLAAAAPGHGPHSQMPYQGQQQPAAVGAGAQGHGRAGVSCQPSFPQAWWLQAPAWQQQQTQQQELQAHQQLPQHNPGAATMSADPDAVRLSLLLPWVAALPWATAPRAGGRPGPSGQSSRAGQGHRATHPTASHPGWSPARAPWAAAGARRNSTSSNGGGVKHGGPGRRGSNGPGSKGGKHLSEEVVG